MITVREAREGDVDAIRDFFVLAYGKDYAYPQYYNIEALKKLVYSDNTILLVAEEDERLLGTASVVTHVGAYNDLLGEFGRLVVHPEARSRGVGQLLMQGRIDRVQERLHVGIVENRTVHVFSQKISARNGFVCAGFMPAKLLTDHRESVALYVRYFGEALELRRNHPRIISEAIPLAELAMRHAGMEPDAIADVSSAPYVLDESFELEQFQTQGYATLLRLERGRVHTREIFGPLRLHYGLFQLRARDSSYLIARDGERLAGAIGFARDPAERAVRVFELISASEKPIRFLLEQLLVVCHETLDVEFIEIDVNAHSPRMQRTLLELGFLPCAYVPAYTFHEVERLDVIKMVRLRSEPDFSRVCLDEPSQEVAHLVMNQFLEKTVDPRIIATANNSQLFAGLTDEQVAHLARSMELEVIQPGETVFSAGEPAGKLYLVLRGEVCITSGDGSRCIANLAAGACVGERSLMTGLEHGYSTRAVGEVELAMLTREALDQLVRRRPDIGVTLYRNLAREVAEKLQ